MYQIVNGYDLPIEIQGTLLKKLLKTTDHELKYLCAQDNYGLRLDIDLKNCTCCHRDGAPQCDKDGAVKQYLTLAIEVSGIDLNHNCRYFTEEPAKALNEFMIFANSLGYRTCRAEAETAVQAIVHRAIEQQEANGFNAKVKQVLHNQKQLLGNYRKLLRNVPPDGLNLKRIYDIEKRGNGRLLIHTICLNAANNHDFDIACLEHGGKLAMYDPCKECIVLKCIEAELHKRMRRKFLQNDLARLITHKAQQLIDQKTTTARSKPTFPESAERPPPSIHHSAS